VIPWTGPQRIAVVPVFNEQVDPVPADDWRHAVGTRVYYDPVGADGFDASLQNYIQAISYGQASISGHVFPVVRSPDADVTGAAMRSLPAGHGYTMVLAVLPHSFGPHRGGAGWFGVPPLNGITAFARVAMFEDPAMTRRQRIGVWAMEIVHAVADMGDLYLVQPNLGSFDMMAAPTANSHPSAYTKRLLGWVPPAAVHTHTTRSAVYDLHAIALRQPPPPGRVTAVRMWGRASGNRFWAEARLGLDPYDRRDFNGDGIPSEGVIVYEVAGEIDVYLRTPQALTVGQSYGSDAEDFRLSVTASITGGFRIAVRVPSLDRRPVLPEKLDELLELYDRADTAPERRQLRVEIGQLQSLLREQQC
ncbi:MAG TPA: hypothetical protein VK324_12910, partial [Tepidisphaeraceae bacterium]|nr:hypothetical protein [Tepidisphaeraceae bacterium]